MGTLQNIVFREEPELEYEQIIVALRELQRRDKERRDEERRDKERRDEERRDEKRRDEFNDYLWQSLYDIRPRFIEVSTIKLPRNEFKTGNPTKICSGKYRKKYLGVRVPFTKTICSLETLLEHDNNNPIKIINQIIIQMNLFVIQNEFLFYLSKIFKTNVVNIKMLVANEINKVCLEKLAICMKKCKSPDIENAKRTIKFWSKNYSTKNAKKTAYITYNANAFLLPLKEYLIFNKQNEDDNITNDAIKVAKEKVIFCFSGCNIKWNTDENSIKNTAENLNYTIQHVLNAIQRVKEASMVRCVLLNKKSNSKIDILLKLAIINERNKIISMVNLTKRMCDIKSELYQKKTEQCSICLDSLYSLDCVKTKCLHIYHKKCIKKYFGQFITRPCPLCRTCIYEPDLVGI